MSKWTAKDEKELVAYENELTKSEFIRKHAGWVVGGVFAVMAVSFIALAILAWG